MFSRLPQGRAVPCTALLLFATLASAQTPNECDNGRYLDTITYPVWVESLCDGITLTHGGLFTGASARPAIADFTGDHRLDAFMVIGGRPMLSVGPGALDFNYPMSLPSQSFWMTAVAALEFGDGLLPMMVASTDTGIQTWKLDGATGMPIATFAGAPAWSLATKLLSADLDGDGHEELVGFFDRGLRSTEIRVGRLNRSGHVTEIEAATFAIPMPSAGTLDWNTSRPGMELFISYEARVFVLNEELAPVDSQVLSAFEVSTAAITDHSGPGLAVVTRTGTTDSLTVLRPGYAEAPVSLGNFGTTMLVAGDYATYDRGDLVIAGTSGIRALPNLSRIASAAFDGTINDAYPNLAEDGVAMGNLANWIVAADFDNDLDADLFLHDESRLSTVVSFSTARSESHLAPKVQYPLGREVTLSDQEDQLDTFTIELQHVGWHQLRDTTHFDLEAWDPDGGTGVYYSRVPKSQMSNGVIPIDFEMEAFAGGGSMVLVRPVTIDASSGDVIEVGPDLRLRVPLDPTGPVTDGPVPSGTDPDPPPRNAGGGGPPTPGGG